MRIPSLALGMFERGRRWSTRYGAALLLVNFAMGAGAAPAEPIRVLALGDSLTAGLGLPAEQSFPAQLERALAARGYDVRVINAGVSGDTSAGGLARLDWVLADKPHVAIVELGANDGLRGLDPARTYANIDAILTRLRSEKVRVLLAGMLAPPNLGREYAGEFRQAYQRLAREHGVAFYPFFLEGVAAQPKLNQPDGLHPTAEGVAVIVERILPEVTRVLDGKK